MNYFEPEPDYYQDDGLPVFLGPLNSAIIGRPLDYHRNDIEEQIKRNDAEREAHRKK